MTSPKKRISMDDQVSLYPLKLEKALALAMKANLSKVREANKKKGVGGTLLSDLGKKKPKT